jgi:hypothetical protein
VNSSNNTFQKIKKYITAYHAFVDILDYDEDNRIDDAIWAAGYNITVFNETGGILMNDSGLLSKFKIKSKTH